MSDAVEHPFLSLRTVRRVRALFLCFDGVILSSSRYRRASAIAVQVHGRGGVQLMRLQFVAVL